ncbi:related to cytochrome P450 CYP2 subfamily [Phialocephala subalpina]|uniref:Related to cytochrome P450 CYP2 subfamily n=1 Tax=Phialocephala subalpina TaxID=576137 RepID=A0A1L7WNF2_9HELO|nr:related to cytochrome P450 CYP2 subfamily [Phialocephala subalpina]
MSFVSVFFSWYTWAGLIAFPIIVLLNDIWTWSRMPKGPMPLPFLGNRLPKNKPWIQFQEWSKKYGPIYTIWVGRRPTIVLSDPEIAVDLMEKRSNKYSSRPRFVVMGEILGTGSVLVQPYGKDWSIRRKLLHRAMTPAALRTYKPRQEAESTRLAFQVLQKPSNWERSFDRFTASVVFSIAYGHRIDSVNAKIVRDRLEFMQFMASLNVPGAYLAEKFPILKYIPSSIAPWKKDIEEHARAETNSSLALVEGVRQDIRIGKEKGLVVAPSLTQGLLAVRDEEKILLPDKDFSVVPASLFGAGSDTTASTMCSAMLAFVTHPYVLDIAHAEMDVVVGTERTPTFDDETSLPYLRALCKEVLRWRPVAVLGGTPHASSEDDVYQGWRIPSGTTILGNSWAINLNEEYYPNPQYFNPARFLDEKDPRYQPELKGAKNHPAKKGHSSFGWGRRICPGAELAENSLFIALSKLVWSFDILPTREYDTFDYTDGFNIRPRPFDCQIRIRSEKHLVTLEKENIAANKYMELFPAFE